MPEKIKLVQGDNRPYITLTVKQADDTPIDLTGCTVRLYFRPAGNTDPDNVKTIVCSLLTDGSDGKVMFSFADGVLDKDGQFEGEVEVDYGTEVQTVYEVLKFSVRKQFN